MNIIAIENGWLVQTTHNYLGSNNGAGFFCATKEEVGAYITKTLRTQAEDRAEQEQQKKAEMERFQSAKCAGVPYAGDVCEQLATAARAY